MSTAPCPHVLGIDDGPFDKKTSRDTAIVGVMMEGARRVESIATERFAIDGDAVTDFLADWITGLRCFPALQAVALGGITIAGLAVVDVRALHAATKLPVLVVNRRDPARSQLEQALRTAGLEARLPIVERTPVARCLEEGLYVAAAGADDDEAERLVRATLDKARIPEPLRVAHLFARALEDGESRGRA